MKKTRLIIGICLLCLFLIMTILSYRERFKGDYKYNRRMIEYYEEHIRECKNLEQEMLDEARRETGFFATSYESLARSYRLLVYDDEDKIKEYTKKQVMINVKAGIFLTIAVAGLIIGIKQIKTATQDKGERNNEEKNSDIG